MTHRLTEAELAELECNADIYPHIGVIDHLNLLRWAYEEIDRLQAASTTPIACPKQLNAPWGLTFDRDDTSYTATISDSIGNDLATSHPYRLPERGETIPPLLMAMQVMRSAPELFGAIRDALRDTGDILRAWDQPSSKQQLIAVERDLRAVCLKAMAPA